MSRTIIVSNRLPVTAQRTDQRFVFTQSTGGLATGLASVHTMQETIWIGWPGMLTERTDEKIAITDALRPHRMHPVFMNHEAYAQYYEGFCNSIIWPLFHHFPHPPGCYHSQWQQYQAVNERFADAVCLLLQAGDQVWVQDYQLLLLPQLLRQRHPELTIGFFLHIPFPAPDVFQGLAWHSDLLEGVLGADLLAFQTTEYANNFLATVRQLLQIDTAANRILLPTRVVDVTAIPMGIDYEKFATYASAPAILDQATQLRRQLTTAQVILSADRLDYTKGILQRLTAFELLLSDYPALLGTVTMVLLVSPSRAGLAPYRALKAQLDEAVDRINGSYNQPDWIPIHYRYLTVDLPQMAVLYSVADVALVTPFRDGMNLIAKEYVASRRTKTGVLILSEMAGAAHELTDALLINPCDIQGMADAMAQGLCMPTTEQRVRMTRMQQIVRYHDVNQWAACFGQQLQQAATQRKRLKNYSLTAAAWPGNGLIPVVDLP